MDFQILKFSKPKGTENFPGIKITFAEEEENILEREESEMIATFITLWENLPNFVHAF